MSGFTQKDATISISVDALTNFAHGSVSRRQNKKLKRKHTGGPECWCQVKQGIAFMLFIASYFSECMILYGHYMVIKGWVTDTQILAKAAFGFDHKRFANVKMWLEKGVPQS
jgi:hypothetical protein